MTTKQVKRFSVYWVDLNPTRGSEMRKLRPCVVVSPDEMNNALATVIVVPLTGTIVDWPFRVAVTSTSKRSSAACDQIRTISKERLRRKAGTLKPSERVLLLGILQQLFAE